MSTITTLENRARRAAARVGLRAKKSRWRRWSIDNHAGFMIVDPYRNCAVAGYRYVFSPEDVIEWCRSIDHQAA
jgi:hypothetical protein